MHGPLNVKFKTVSRVTVLSGLTEATQRFRGRLCLYLHGGRCRWRPYVCTKHCYTSRRLRSVMTSQTLAEPALYPIRRTVQFTLSDILYNLPYQTHCTIYPIRHTAQFTLSDTLYNLPYQTHCTIYPIRHIVQFTLSDTLYNLPYQTYCTIYPIRHIVQFTLSDTQYNLPYQTHCTIP